MTGPSKKFTTRITAWSLGALVAALLLGIFGHTTGAGWVEGLSDAIAPIGGAWINALQMTVIPLVVTQLVSAIAGSHDDESIGALSGKAILLFAAMLIGAGIITLLVATPAVRLYPVDPTTVETLNAQASTSAAAAQAGGSPISLGEWLQGLVPTNIFEAAAGGAILPLLIFTVVFAAAVARLPAPRRAPIVRLFEGAAAAMMILIFWILWATPVGVFALVLGLTVGTGLDAAGLLAFFVVVVSGAILFVTVLLYPFTALFGRTSVRTFAKAVLPSQLVAVSTRSSLASLPALVEGGREHLKLPPSATGFVLPLCVSVFRMSGMTSGPTRLAFLSYIYGIPLGFGDYATWMLAQLILGLATVGIPRGGGGFITLPAFLAVGIPVEGIVLVVAVDTIPDIMKTLVNVTGDMSAATILSRRHRSASGEPLERAAPGMAGMAPDPAPAVAYGTGEDP